MHHDNLAVVWALLKRSDRSDNQAVLKQQIPEWVSRWRAKMHFHSGHVTPPSYTVAPPQIPRLKRF